jgi:hypothetical protein
MTSGMTLLIILSLAAVTIFFVSPQLKKFRETLGINQKLASGGLTAWQKTKLMLLGMKTPVLTTMTVAFTFITTEGDRLMTFEWGAFMSAEHAAMVTAGLWMATLWAHFSGIITAAAMPPAPGMEKRLP